MNRPRRATRRATTSGPATAPEAPPPVPFRRRRIVCWTTARLSPRATTTTRSARHGWSARRTPCGSRVPTFSWISARCVRSSTGTTPSRRSTRRTFPPPPGIKPPTIPTRTRTSPRRRRRAGGSTRSRRPCSPARRGSYARPAPGCWTRAPIASGRRPRTRRCSRARCRPAARSGAGPRRSPRTLPCAWARGGSKTAILIGRVRIPSPSLKAKCRATRTR
mmetsp:Transcript_15134/g.64787  ORF Transcript_15134/g.64787 Transcript_15134/m.64787 type:complete len:220 (-) Transcript_15134:2941-3600(-)